MLFQTSGPLADLFCKLLTRLLTPRLGATFRTATPRLIQSFLRSTKFPHLLKWGYVDLIPSSWLRYVVHSKFEPFIIDLVDSKFRCVRGKRPECPELLHFHLRPPVPTQFCQLVKDGRQMLIQCYRCY